MEPSALGLEMVTADGQQRRRDAAVLALRVAQERTGVTDGAGSGESH
jgi:hypothetical protein